MPQLVGPQTLTVGQATGIPDPNQAGGNPSIGCQIQNSSPYQLQVVAGGNTLSIQPFFAQTVEISGAPMTVDPLAVGGLTAACTITFAFLLGTPKGTGVMLPGGQWVETPPQEDGPLTAAAIASALTSQGTVDSLAASTQASGQWINATIPAPHSYQSVLVRIISGNNVQPLWVTVSDSSVAGSTAFVAACRPAILSGGHIQFQALVPCANKAGGTLQVVVQGGVGETSLQVFVFGLTIGPVPAVRTDGRAYPLGAWTNTGALVGGVGPVTVVPAPVTPNKILVKSINMSSGGSNLFVTLSGFINNGPNQIAQLTSASALVIEPEGGLLLDDATGLSIGATANVTAAAQVQYDVIT